MAISILELRHLRTLSALRATGSLTRAADLLSLTQSALSQQVRQLEDRYGWPLFERKSAPLVFTALGARLLRLADEVLPGVVLVPWQRPSGEALEGTVNMLCGDRLTDMGEGATYQSTFLDVEAAAAQL